MLRVHGMNLWPDIVDRVVLDHDSVVDYRAEVWLDQELSEHLSMELDVLPDRTRNVQAALIRTIAQELRDATQLGFEVGIRTVSESDVGSTPSGDVKPRRWRDRRSESRPEEGPE
jgi:hypothetical protein